MGNQHPAPVRPPISYEFFRKVDIRAGTIVGVAEIPGADSLMRLTVDLGDHRRTILAGIRQERSDPQEIEGRQALFVVNLESPKMMGIVSEGMLLDIGYDDGITPVLAVPEKSVPDGTRAG